MNKRPVMAEDDAKFPQKLSRENWFRLAEVLHLSIAKFFRRHKKTKLAPVHYFFGAAE